MAYGPPTDNRVTSKTVTINRPFNPQMPVRVDDKHYQLCFHFGKIYRPTRRREVTLQYVTYPYLWYDINIGRRLGA
jgi:hypothetical protein